MKANTLLITAVLLAGNTAWAHGGQDHDHAAMVKEQQDWGIAGDAGQVTRTVTLTMTDNMRFAPGHIEVKQGETLRLRVRNAGKLMHEIVLGTRGALEKHAAQMVKHPGMEHDEPHMAHVAPGKTGELIWTFNRAGEFEFACLIAGHFQAGMRGTIRVTASQAQAPAAQPYSGQQARDIKALSQQDLRAYEQGQGHGLAKAAELNGYPGPLHVLQLAQELQLSDEQRRHSEELMTRHRAEAQRLGAELIAAERQLDEAFASRTVQANSLQTLTLAAGEKLARLRAEHLRTHLAQTALLTPEQIARYQELRGYGPTNSNPPHQEMHHGHKHH